MGVGSRQEDRMNAGEKEQDYRNEAARLALTPRQEQRAVVAWLHDIAADPEVRKADRQEARERAKALESLLFSTKKARRNKT